MNLNERIKEIIRIKCNGNVSKFTRSAGLSTGFLKGIKNSAQPQTIYKIIDAYPDINKIWLLTGEGEMLVPVTNNDTTPSNDNIKHDAARIISDLKERNLELKDENKWLKQQIALKDEQIKHFLRKGEECIQPDQRDMSRKKRDVS